jgi:hypothetical protein
MVQKSLAEISFDFKLVVLFGDRAALPDEING